MVAGSGSSKRVSWVVSVVLITTSRERSIGARQSQHVLGEIVQGHLLGHRRDLVEPDLAPQPLDVKLFRVPEAAERLERRVAGVPPGVRGEELRGVGFAPAGTPVVEEPG